jgi:hypothetical protein
VPGSVDAARQVQCGGIVGVYNAYSISTSHGAANNSGVTCMSVLLDLKRERESSSSLPQETRVRKDIGLGVDAEWWRLRWCFYLLLHHTLKVLSPRYWWLVSCQCRIVPNN